MRTSPLGANKALAESFEFVERRKLDPRYSNGLPESGLNRSRTKLDVIRENLTMPGYFSVRITHWSRVLRIPEDDNSSPSTSHNMPPFMRPRDLAALLHVSPKTLAEYRMNGTGPEYVATSQRCVIYTAAAVEKWLSKHRRTSTADAITQAA